MSFLSSCFVFNCISFSCLFAFFFSLLCISSFCFSADCWVYVYVVCVFWCIYIYFFSVYRISFPFAFLLFLHQFSSFIRFVLFGSYSSFIARFRRILCDTQNWWKGSWDTNWKFSLDVFFVAVIVASLCFYQKRNSACAVHRFPSSFYVLRFEENSKGTTSQTTYIYIE